MPRQGLKPRSFCHQSLFSPPLWLPLQHACSLTRVSLPPRPLSFLTINEPCLTSCGFLRAAAVSHTSLPTPWLPAQPLNTVGSQTIFGKLICSHRLRLHTLLLAQYGGCLQLIKEMEGIFIRYPLPVQSELSPTAGPVPTLKLTPEIQTRAVASRGQSHRCHLALFRVRP